LPERDLQALLRTVTIERRPGRFCFVDLDEVPSGAIVQATVVESEGTTAVVDSDALGPRTETPEFVAAWLTVAAQSSLDAVGLTAALAGALAQAGIPCNVLAGLHHDHLLVPDAKAQMAIEVLHGLRNGGASPDER
jgi:uncharacterized protein